MEEYTRVSKAMKGKIEDQDLTLPEAIAFLKATAKQRSVSDIIKRVMNKPAMSNEQLKTMLIGNLKECQPAIKEDSIRRNVSNWLKDTCYSISKSNAVLIAFALRFSEEQADTLLKYICKEGFHYRGREDIICSYALSHGMRYSEAMELIRETEEFESKKKAGQTALCADEYGKNRD